MNLTLKQIEELPLKEKRQLRACINYFNTTEYLASKRRKKVMQAIQEIENADTADTNSRPGE